MAKKSLDGLSNNELDAIATHTGCLIYALNRVDEQKVMPFFVAELKRLEALACDVLQARGVISEIDFIELEAEEPTSDPGADAGEVATG